MKNKKSVLVAMSGGVDSSVAAYILRKKYKIIGAFIKSYSETKNELTGQCSWMEDYSMAKKIAFILKIPIIKLNFEKEYKKYVLDKMFESYKKGITPNPDILCNSTIKFPLLWSVAKNMGINYIATGHYARIKKARKGFNLLRAKDEKKDQSYFLSTLTQEDLSHTLFPIGDIKKNDVRKLAKKYGFPNYDKPSTKGICFLGNVDFKKFIWQKIKSKKGKVVDEKGLVIGTHKGVHYYTIGERVRPSIGIEIKKGDKSQERFFVAKKDSFRNILTVVPKNHDLLKTRVIYLKNLHWINEDDKKEKIKVKVRLRHLGKLMPCILETKKNRWQFTLNKPEFGVSPGQTAVFYIGKKLISSGEII